MSLTVHSYAAAVPRSKAFVLSKALSIARSCRARIVIKNTTSSTTRFFSDPPLIALTESTTLSMGSVFLETMVCSPSIIAAAQTMGSTLFCGSDPCPPRPWTVIVRFFFAAMRHPVFTATVPAGIVGQLWKPKRKAG